MGIVEKTHAAAPSTLADVDRFRLRRFVEALGDDGLVLLLRWRYALDYDAIARTLGVSVAAAQRRHSRALERLRATLPDLFRDDIG